MVVHAGLLPYDTTKPFSDASQPLIQADSAASSANYDADLSRTSSELSILFDVPQNTVPWNLMNIRSVKSKGTHKGDPTKSGSKGTPWSKIWNEEMKKCKGPGSWFADGMGEYEVEHEQEEDESIEEEEDDEMKRDEVDEEKLKCSPMTIIYGHAGGYLFQSARMVADVSWTGIGYQAVQ
jgi:hypothetical protein